MKCEAQQDVYKRQVWQCEECGHQEAIGSREQLKEMSGNEKALTVELHRPYIDEITCKMCIRDRVYGGGAEGPAVLVNKLQAELADTMAMCGAHNLAEIRRDMLFGY